MRYKLKVPVCGAIILNPNLDKVLLVKGWKSKTWSFPKGKINQNEKEVDCAIREVLEETGLDVTPYLITTNYLPKAPNANLDEPDHIERTIRECRMRLYFAWNVPEYTVFKTQTLNEISDITWHSLSDVFLAHYEKKKSIYFLMAPFLDDIQTWIEAKHRDITLSSYEEVIEDEVKVAWYPEISSNVLQAWRNFKFDRQKLIACFNESN
ncbi:mRNA-decapping enzyme subunit 2 [Coelomomyces lativittatus]|nr:mRNA-decapping enzyme subunit 2 [Coelomomyces lativittatus]